MMHYYLFMFLFYLLTMLCFWIGIVDSLGESYERYKLDYFDFGVLGFQPSNAPSKRLQATFTQEFFLCLFESFAFLVITHLHFNALTFPCGPCVSAYLIYLWSYFQHGFLLLLTVSPLPWISSIDIIDTYHQSISSIDIVNRYHQ